MVILVQRHVKVSEQIKLVDGVDVGPSKWCVCECCLNRSVHMLVKV